jgi:probable HAF family extracellular repeat protein
MDGRRQRRLYGWTLGLCVALAAVAQAEWMVTELPTLGGSGGMEAWAVNEGGVVCGHGPDANEIQCVFRYDGNMTVLPHLEPTNPHSFASDINSNGTVVGFSWDAGGRERAVYWVGTTLHEIPLPAGVDPDRSSRAEAVNDAGVITGFYFDNDWSAKPYYYDGTVHDLAPALAAEGFIDQTYADDINNHGVICGHAKAGVYQLWTYDIATETVTVLGAMDPLSGAFSKAINDSGVIAGRGRSSVSSPYHALLHDGVFRVIDPTVTDAQWSWDMNNGGRVVGTAHATGVPDWSWYSDGPGDGSIIRIDLPGWTEVNVEGINGHDVIVGYGETPTSGGESRAFICAPPPGDADHDGDVDLDDYAEFAACLSGPNEGDAFVAPSAGCLATFDFLPADGDVDLEDFAVFQQAFTGSGG